MAQISEIDSNFKVDTKLDIKGLKFINIENKPFKIYGVEKLDGIYRRMPKEVAAKVNDGVSWLHTNTAGGRVRFKTDSPYVAINAVYDSVGKMPHFALTGSIGFDMYVKDENSDQELYYKTFVPPFNITDCYEGILHFSDSKMRQITINFPTYSGVKELYIGLEEISVLDEAKDYKITKPIVYYGSSITQGGCVSRPGNTYQAIISRKFNADHINLGFSGNARGEDIMADYIKNLDMSVFVYDYDYNAPSAEHLENTHERFFKKIREAQPELPVVMMTAPVFSPDSYHNQRKEVIRKTYENALAAGDKNVYFIDGKELMAIAQNEGTVDNCHPNDLGFYSMAEALSRVLEKII